MSRVAPFRHGLGTHPATRLPERRPAFGCVAVVVVLLGVVGAPSADAQLRPSSPLQEAYFAWDDGRYVEALEGYLEVLHGPNGPAFTSEVALLTGELHPVERLDNDGAGLRVSHDGAYRVWHRPRSPGAQERVTVVSPTDGGDPIVLPGEVAAVSSDGRAAWMEEGDLRVAELTGGREGRRLSMEALIPAALRFAPDGGDLYLTAVRREEPGRLRILRLAEGGDELEVLSLGPGHATEPLPVSGGRFLVFSRPERPSLPPGAGPSPAPTPNPGLGVLDLETGRAVHLSGRFPSVAADGSLLAFVAPPEGGDSTGFERIAALALDPDAVPENGEPEVTILARPEHPVDRPAVSPDGDRVAYQAQPATTWEIFVAAADGSGDVRQLTREVQHDQFPAWVRPDRLIAMKGEFRHRRSHLYDVETGEGYRLFSSDRLRTIAPEYDWAAHPEGLGILLSGERDGDTISPNRPIFWVDLTLTVAHDALVTRLEEWLEAERALLQAGARAFAPVEEAIRPVADAVSAGRVFHYARDLYSFGPKFVTEPGNARTTEYLAETLEAWGYEVELQWFDPLGVRAANVVATLPGTTDPEVVYVISSHFDSVPFSPGADDNSSGTTALLEAARVLRDHPRRATIQFVFLNAEEAGLLGAREYVRRALEDGTRITGVLNNDMVGWSRSHRMDNTIRHANPAIRNLQHAAAHRFSDLITYDAFYTRGTDAAVFHDAYGEIVGGIGSYPVLGSPHYHQPSDRLHIVDHRLVAEVSRTTVATIMLLADSPAPVSGLMARERDGEQVVEWSESAEDGVTGYRVRALRDGGPAIDLGTVEEPRISLPAEEGITGVEVRTVRDNGTEGWDWAGLDL